MTAKQEKILIFLMSLLLWLAIGQMGVFLYRSYFPVIMPNVLTVTKQPFEICNESNRIFAGDILCYRVHYYKYTDIPGELSKQLISKDDTVVIPLQSTYGSLPIGNIEANAYVEIPPYTPPGVYRLKLSVVYDFGDRVTKPVHAYTDYFTVVAR